jgi:mRNA-degrading endonuclease RelE of RelBE toxin-antitoxin system
LVDPRYGGQYRQRSGDYRIFFAIEHGNVIFMKHTYKGTLTVVRVLRRDKAYE